MLHATLPRYIIAQTLQMVKMRLWVPSLKKTTSRLQVLTADAVIILKVLIEH